MEHRPYPPDWCSDGTMAYLLDMSVRTFRRYVADGVLPPGVRREGSVRWDREEVRRAWRVARNPAKVGRRASAPAPVDPIMEAASGQTQEPRRGAA